MLCGEVNINRNNLVIMLTVISQHRLVNVKYYPNLSVAKCTGVHLDYTAKIQKKLNLISYNEVKSHIVTHVAIHYKIFQGFSNITTHNKFYLNS